MKIKRNYKDSTFRKYSNDVDIEIITLEDAIMGNRKGDLVFRIDGKIIVFMEHQSTINPNMPLRILIYIAKEYEKQYFGKDIYSKKRIMIPTPEIYVFYNGTEDTPISETLKLSDSYIKKCGKMSLEVAVAIEETIKEFIKQGILVEFLKENGGEIMSFLFEELTREECEAIREQDGYFRGKEEGIKKSSIGIAKKMKDNGETIDNIILYTGLSAEDIEKA